MNNHYATKNPDGQDRAFDKRKQHYDNEDYFGDPKRIKKVERIMEKWNEKRKN